MKIGITEQGDGSLDLSWIDKLNKVDGAIIISKGFNERFALGLLLNQDKIIYHATITGLGGTIIEPNVMNYKKMICNIKQLIQRGFNPEHIVIRIDPIIGSTLFSQIPEVLCNTQSILKKNYQELYLTIIRDIIESFYDLHITRFRYSYLDLYNHVINRFEKAGFNIPPTNNLFNSIDNKYKLDDITAIQQLFSYLQIKYPNISFESCAESNVLEQHKIGCISKKDFNILNLDVSYCKGNSKQRPLCLCCSAKTELLNDKHQCKHQCLYCYWK